MLSNIKNIFANAKMNKGFTLLEILLVVAAIAILAGIVIVALNPQKQLAETRNADRQSAVNTILNAVYQYSIDNNGAIPTGIPAIGASCAATANSDICVTGGTCTNLVDLAVLTNLGTYLVSMPTDPSTATANSTGYQIVNAGNNRVTVCAPDAEQSAVISVTR